MRIIYIAGDGRSGSTILDAIIGNSKNSISVGECCRFWVRFYERDTMCGCSEKIEECLLWANIDKKLSVKFSSYNPKEFLRKVKFLLYYKNFKKIPDIVCDPNWKEFCDMVEYFYISISEITQKDTIIDSTKFPNWGHFLVHLNFCEIKIIHLERNIQSVANSWKKKVLLPEYYDKKVFMPIKSNYLILKTWLKVKYLCTKLKNNSSYLFVNYEMFCADPVKEINRIGEFLNMQIDQTNLVIPYNHSVGGNPIRNTGESKIVVRSVKDKLQNLNTIEKYMFKSINSSAKYLIR